MCRTTVDYERCRNACGMPSRQAWAETPVTLPGTWRWTMIDIRGWGGTFVRAGVASIIILATLLVGATRASAHPTLLFSDPPAGTAIPDSPRVINLMFNEPVTVGKRALAVTGEAGEVALSAAIVTQGGRMVTARAEQRLDHGTYIVRWRVTGADGDPMEDEYRFAVGTALSGASVARGDASAIAWADALLRWLLFAGLAVALGGIAAERFTRAARVEKPALRALRPWTMPGILIGLLAAAGLSARLITDAGTASTLWIDRIGQLLGVEAAAFALALVLVALGRRTWTVAPLLVVAAAEGLRSHANVAVPGWGALLTAVHVAAVAVWLGALLHVSRAAHAWRRERVAMLWVFLGYMRLAAWVFRPGRRHRHRVGAPADLPLLCIQYHLRPGVGGQALSRRPRDRGSARSPGGRASP
ncbi:hypothetical protein DI005_22405 [Prauserella sp. PE36]|nr:hypothetical protein DI005_22405 [Prauserella sp. PE36]